MRWSLASFFFIFAVLIANEVAISASINVDSNILLEARSPVVTRGQARTQNTPHQNPHNAPSLGPPAGPLSHNPPQNPHNAPSPSHMTTRAMTRAQTQNTPHQNPHNAPSLSPPAGPLSHNPQNPHNAPSPSHMTTRSMTRAQTQNTPHQNPHNAPSLSPPAGSLFHNPPPQNRALPLKPKDKVKRAKAAHQVRSSVRSPVRAHHFKKSSRAYRKVAGEGFTYHRTGAGGLVKKKTGGSIGPGMHADHIVEAQTVAHAVNKAGYSKSDIHHKTLDRVKDILNGPENMAVISAQLNMKKGRHTTSKLAGGAGSSDPHVHRYGDDMRGKTTALSKQLNEEFKKNPDGAMSVHVLSAQMKTQ